MSSLENLRLRAMALRSSIHNEHQLSAIELTAMCAKKTNEIIEVINELSDLIAALEKSITNNGAVYDENSEILKV